MRTRPILTAAALAITLAACGNGDSTAAEPAGQQAPAQATELTQPTAGASSIDVLAGQSGLGDILVGPDGLTLYAFTNDTEARSTCYGTCADAWPPVLVSADWTAGPGLDFGIFATTTRDDGQLQLVAGQWPLYYFAGDAAPGDLNGQGSGDVWYAVDLDGRLIERSEDAAPEATADGGDPAADGGDPAAESGDPAADGGDPAVEGGDPAAGIVSVGSTELGDALVDEAGLTLYGFTDDGEGNPTCNGACADAWPPVIVDGSALPDGLDPAVFSVVERADGSFQLKAGRWPLYRFAGDAGPGDVNGQGSGGVWFVAAPDGSLIGAGSGEPAAETDRADTGTDRSGY